MFVLSVRDNTTDAFKQVHRDGPVLVDFKGETAKDDRKLLLLHRLFNNRDQFGNDHIERTVDAYASERNRLLYPDESPADHAKRRREVVESWPFSPELLVLLEDSILMAEAAQDRRTAATSAFRPPPQAPAHACGSPCVGSHSDR